jgi:hypothetical protein
MYLYIRSHWSVQKYIILYWCDAALVYDILDIMCTYTKAYLNTFCNVVRLLFAESLIICQINQVLLLYVKPYDITK